MKKIFLMLVVSAMIIPQVANAALLNASPELISDPIPTLYDNAGVSFDDVDDMTEYADSIMWMADNGVINGYSDGTFGPDNCVNRVEMLKMLFEVLSVDENGYQAELFSDTPEGVWYTNYVKAAKSRGTINGYPDGTFKPGQCVNRAEAVKMALLEFNGGVMPVYTGDNTWSPIGEYEDVSADDWYYEYLNYALDADVLGLDHTYKYSRNVFGIGDDMSRKEVAEMLYRMKSVVDNKVDYYSYKEPFAVGAVPFYEACNVDGSALKGDLNDVLPIDSTMIMGVDHYTSSVVSDLQAFIDKFPAGTLWDDMLTSMDLDATLRSMIENKWEFVFGMKMPQGSMDIDNINMDDAKIFVAGRIGDTDSAENYFAELLWMDYKSDISCSAEGDVLYWTSVVDDFYFAKYGDIFLVTNTDANRTEAVDRLKNGTGYNPSSSMNQNTIGQMYMDVKAFGDLFAPVYSMMGMDQVNDYLASMNNLYMSFDVDGSGVSADTEMKLDSNSSLIDMYNGYYVTLVNRVPDTNVVGFIENPDMTMVFDSFMMNFAGMSGMETLDLSTVKDDFINNVLVDSNLTVSDLDAIVDSPFAVSVHNVEGDLPGIIAYVKLDSGEITAGEKVESFIGTLIEQYAADMMLTDNLTKMTSSVGKLKKIVIDDPNSERLEFNYGIVDSMLVVAFYPNFESAWGRNSLYNSTKYNSAVNSLGGVYGAGVSYLDVDNLIGMIDDIAAGVPEMTDADLADYEMVKSYINVFDYMISSSKLSGTTLNSKMKLKMK